nr:immunoglobulin light chain junction region [Macaca mulatta]
CHQYNDWITF